MMCHQQQYYFETAKCMPTKADGDSILMFNIKEQEWMKVPISMFSESRTEWWVTRFSHWMQMPKAPSPTDAHAFLE